MSWKKTKLNTVRIPKFVHVPSGHLNSRHLELGRFLGIREFTPLQVPPNRFYAALALDIGQGV